MAITLSDTEITVLRLLGLASGNGVKIFKVDEDKLEDFGSFVKTVFGITDDSFALVESIFREIADETTDTAAFKAVADAVKDVGTFINGITDPMGTGIDIFVPAVKTAVIMVKTQVAATIALNAAPLVAAVLSGVGIPIALLQKAIMKQILDAAFDALMTEFVQFLVQEMTVLIDNLLLTGENKDAIVAKVINLGTALAAVEIKEAGGGGGQAQALAEYNEHEVLQKINKVAFSFYETQKAYDDWKSSADDVTDLSSDGSRSLWVVALKELLDWVVDTLKEFGVMLMRETIDTLVEILLGMNQTFNEADEKVKQKVLQMLADVKVTALKYAPGPIGLPVPGPVMELITHQSRAMGTATSDADSPSRLDLPVGQSRPIGTVQQPGPHDLSALDLPVTHLKTVGTAHSDASGDVAAMDVDVEPI